MTALAIVPAQSDTGFGVCKFSREQIRQAWANRLINNSAYVWLAVQFMQNEEKLFTLDFNEFCDIWSHEISPGKVKRLDVATVKNIINDWERKGMVSIPSAPVQLQLLF